MNVNAKTLLTSCVVGMSVFLGSCSSELSGSDTLLSDSGYVNLKVNAKPDFTRGVTIANYGDVNNYTVQILNGDGGVEKEFLYSEVEDNTPLELRNGTYTLKAFYGVEQVASRDEFYVEGTQAFTVDANTQTLSVACAPTCAQLKVVFADDMSEYFSDYSVVYKTAALEETSSSITWASADTEPWFVKVNKNGEDVKATISVTRKSDNKTATIEKTYSMTPGKLWTLNISPNNNEGSLGIAITVDESTNDKPVNIEVPSEWI